MILAGDIGGTNSRLILVDQQGGELKTVARADFKSQLYEDLSPIIRQFLQQEGDADLVIRAACFAVAGPVQGQIAKITNLPWQLDAGELSRQLGYPVRLINDFQGAAYGIDALSTDDMRVYSRESR